MHEGDYKKAAWDKKYPDGRSEFGFIMAVAGYNPGLIIEKGAFGRRPASISWSLRRAGVQPVRRTQDARPARSR